MNKLITLIALSATVFLTACANPSAPGSGNTSKADEHAAHHPGAAAPATAPSAATPMSMDDRMKSMQAMRDKMMNAKTPAERQALMDEHMKTMHEGMAMMKGMGNMQGMAGMSGMGAKKDMPMDMAKHHQMMEMRMDMMQTMMEMMMQRMPGAGMPPASR